MTRTRLPPCHLLHRSLQQASDGSDSLADCPALRVWGCGLLLLLRRSRGPTDLATDVVAHPLVPGSPCVVLLPREWSISGGMTGWTDGPRGIIGGKVANLLQRSSRD